MILTRALLLLVAASPGVFGAAPSPNTPAQTPGAQAPAQPAAAAPGMGRLFFSAPERAALDEVRRRPAVVTATAPEPKPLPAAPEYVMLNGVVRRSDGSTAVWLNNRMLEGKRTADGLEVTDSKRAPGAANVTVRVPQAGRNVDLRVGQRLDVTSGKIQERYQVAPPPTAEPSGEPVARELPSAKSPPRRSREREPRELTRDIEGSQTERAQPPAEAKG